ncbi:MAG: single-stranded-DNA-specific exonuclease RecJ [Deltaproteobacteria bacterium]|nr:MAG: single-stranded-DNA-specific exonuclease RecJ [Deltaproteobacteria bacterium]
MCVVPLVTSWPGAAAAQAGAVPPRSDSASGAGPWVVACGRRGDGPRGTPVRAAGATSRRAGVREGSAGRVWRRPSRDFARTRTRGADVTAARYSVRTVWEPRPVDASAVAALAAALDVRPATARCLAARGFDVASARAFLDPRLSALRPPDGLADFDVAVDRLARAARATERVGVFGDYDVDGVTTCALLTGFLRQVGAAPVPRVARRDAGYGFGTADVAHFAEQQCSVVVVGDCGTSDVDAIAHARSLGIDVIVVDHHTVPPATGRHPALALINPLRADSTFPFRKMASVGLAFYLAGALRTALDRAGHFTGDRPRPDVRDLLDLVALGTICDVVPLVDENRILAAAGLRVASRRQRPGLAALLERAGAADAPVTERVVGWRLSPRLNAPGRLGDAAPALALLLSRDAREADRWADALEACNDERRSIQAEVLAEAEAQAEAACDGPAIVVAGEGWPSGVVGIVAAKLAERYRRPAFALAIDPDTGVARGSGRAAGEVHLYRVLEACEGLVDRFGGHAGAAGLTVHRDRIDALRAAIAEAVAAQRDGADAGDPGATSPGDSGDGDARSDAWIDAEVTLAELDEGLVAELDRLAPFGEGNPEPVLLARGLTVVDSRAVGEDGTHLKLRLAGAGGREFGAIAFGQAGDDPGEGAVVDVAFRPSINEWNGARAVELAVKRLRHSPG